MRPTSAILLRNKELFSEGRWLMVNAEDGEILPALGNPQIEGLFQYYDSYQANLPQTDASRLQFDAFGHYQGGFDGAVIIMPKAKDQARMLIARCAALLKPQGQLCLVGENKGGVRSAPKLMGHLGTVNKRDSAKHCSLFICTLETQAPAFDPERWWTQSQYQVAGIEVRVASLPGVFSHKELDAATALLLNNLGELKGAKLLDFACGCGVIGATLKLLRPSATVVQSDISALALAASEKTAALNDIQVRVVPSDGLSALPRDFDGVYTNPPFHTGLRTDYGITQRFIAELSGHMRRGARLLLVANGFLPYPEYLSAHLSHMREGASTKQFKLFEAFKGG